MCAGKSLAQFNKLMHAPDALRSQAENKEWNWLCVFGIASSSPVASVEFIKLKCIWQTSAHRRRPDTASTCKLTSETIESVLLESIWWSHVMSTKSRSNKLFSELALQAIAFWSMEETSSPSPVDTSTLVRRCFAQCAKFVFGQRKYFH